MKTKREIAYISAGPIREPFIIPKGTEYHPASGQEVPAHIKYWAESWPNMSYDAKSWHQHYGFGLTADDVK